MYLQISPEILIDEIVSLIMLIVCEKKKFLRSSFEAFEISVIEEFSFRRRSWRNEVSFFAFINHILLLSKLVHLIIKTSRLKRRRIHEPRKL